MKKIFPKFTLWDFGIWSFSATAVLLSYFLSSEGDLTSTIGSFIGVTALIFIAKGAVIGQIFMLFFCLFYGINSLHFHYYGETITYLGMSLPAVIFNIVSWLRNPYRDTAQVRVGKLTPKRVFFTFLLCFCVTVLFYFLLKAFHTAELLVSTFSVSTSFLASTLSFQRSPWFAVAYAVNDIVLIVLWSITLIKDPSVLPVLVCFFVFLVNDLNGFFSWQKMKKSQSEGK